jgi:apolipoprotein N-acyltransferase
MGADARWVVAARCALAGLCLAAAVPPWGWWPLAFVGIALIDRLLAGRPAPSRFRRMWLVTACWLYPSTIWMVDLSAPGYVVAQAVYAAMFGLLAMAVPPNRGRRLALPGAIVLAEWWRWTWPFGGVPLSTIPMGQVDSPLAPVVRTLGPLLLVAVVVAIGVALSAALDRAWRTVGVVAVVVIAALGWAAVAPDGHAVGEIEVAVVQGGGLQRTRATPEDGPIVLQRHVDASELVQTPVDLVLWPENVVNPRPPYLDQPDTERFLTFDEATEAVQQVARELDTTLIPGWFYAIDDDSTVNYSEVVTADGTPPFPGAITRYDKVRTVPFGEFVPLRWLIEPFAGEALPPRDVQPGTGPAVLDTPVGRVGVAISWEVFFDTRALDAARNGAQLLTNPTNGSSYWLSIVQTQQIASSKLRALETGRWVLQAAPTGFSAIVQPDGDVVARTRIGEQAALGGTVELRDGKTIYVRVGRWPMLTIAVLLLAAAQLVARRRDAGGDDPSALAPPSDLDEHGDGSVVDELDGHVGAEASGGDRRPELA